MAETDLKQIKNIVFDLGGVIINLDRDRAVRRLAELGLSQAEELLDPYEQRGVFLQLESGQITVGEFYDTIRSLMGKAEVTDIMIQDAFNAFLVDLPVERLRTVRALRARGYRTFALSNTNPVMFHSWISARFQAEGLRVNDYFDGIVASFEEGCCKPDVTIFHRLLDRYGVKGEQTLMLDDSPLNTNAARMAGMQAIQVGYTPDTDLQAIAAKL